MNKDMNDFDNAMVKLIDIALIQSGPTQAETVRVPRTMLLELYAAWAILRIRQETANDYNGASSSGG